MPEDPTTDLPLPGHMRPPERTLRWIAIQLRDIDTALQELETELASLQDRKTQLLTEQAALQRQRDRAG